MNNQELDIDVRHYIYTTFVDIAKPPTTSQVANHLGVSIATVEDSFERLANAHHIALAPGTHSIWMAHPFSGIATNFVAEVAGKTYWGN